MQNKQLLLPFFLKLQLFFYNWFFLFGIITLFPVLLFTLNEAQFQAPDFQASEFQANQFILLAIIFFVITVYTYTKRIRILEGNMIVRLGVYMGEICLPQFVKHSYNKTMLRLTLEIPSVNRYRTCYKNFYFVRTLYSTSPYEYGIVINCKDPEQLILLKHLPNRVEKYILKWNNSKTAVE